MADAYDAADPETIPEAVRREAFEAAMVGAQRVLRERGYLLDAIAELELVDSELEARYQALGAGGED